MIEFVQSHVDLMGDVTFTQAELIRRWDRELARKWPKNIQMNLRDFIEIKDTVDSGTFPDYAENEAMLNAFIADKTLCYIRRKADEPKNQLLIDTIEYEKAQTDLVKWNLKINGREAVAEVLEVTDPETGEVTQEYVAPVSEVIPILAEIESTNEEGQAVMIGNPAYLDAVAARDAAQAVIDNAGSEVLELVSQRGGS